MYRRHLAATTAGWKPVPFSGWIRNEMLAVIKKKAETATVMERALCQYYLR